MVKVVPMPRRLRFSCESWKTSATAAAKPSRIRDTGLLAPFVEHEERSRRSTDGGAAGLRPAHGTPHPVGDGDDPPHPLGLVDSLRRAQEKVVLVDAAHPASVCGDSDRNICRMQHQLSLRDWVTELTRAASVSIRICRRRPPDTLHSALY